MKKLTLALFLILSAQADARYIKIANDGSTLPDAAIRGLGTKDWACTLDNKTGLMWEIKYNQYYYDKNVPHTHDFDSTYSFYDPVSAIFATGGGAIQKQYENHGDCYMAVRCDTYALVQDVNKENYCGRGDWRMPAVDELKTLITCINDCQGNGNPNRATFTYDMEFIPDLERASYLSWERDDSSAYVLRLYENVIGGGVDIMTTARARLVTSITPLKNRVYDNHIFLENVLVGSQHYRVKIAIGFPVPSQFTVAMVTRIADPNSQDGLSTYEKGVLHVNKISYGEGAYSATFTSAPAFKPFSFLNFFLTDIKLLSSPSTP